jgi:hypothetical protein
MKYALLPSAILSVTIIISPAYAQFSSFSTGSDNCSSICVKLDLGSANSDNSFNSGFNSGFDNGSNHGSSNLRWQLGVTWRPNPPEVVQVEAEKIKHQLEDNKAIMIALAEAISQNKTEMARGLAILLAPRLGYSDPRKLLAEMKEGSTNFGSANPIEKKAGSTNIMPTPIDKKEDATNIDPANIIQVR